VGRGYSGIHYGGGKIVYFGGGHRSYPGNDVEVFDVLTNTWSQLYPPEFPGDFPGDTTSAKAIADEAHIVYGGSGTARLSPTGKPFTVHSYQQIRHWAGGGGLFLVAHRPAGTWLLNPWGGPEEPWRRVAALPHGGDVQTHLLFDVVDGVHYLLVEGPAHGIYMLDLVPAPAWKRVAELPARGWTNFYAALGVEGDRAEHLVWGFGYWWLVRLPDRWTRLEVATEGIDSFQHVGSGLFLGLRHDKGIFKAYVRKWADPWQEIPLRGQVPSGREGIDAAAPQLAWIPEQARGIYLDAWVHQGDFKGGSAQTYAVELVEDEVDPIPPGDEAITVGVGGDFQSLPAALASGLPAGSTVRLLSDVTGGAILAVPGLTLTGVRGGPLTSILADGSGPGEGLLRVDQPCVIEGLRLVAGYADESYAAVALRAPGVELHDLVISDSAMGIGRSGGGTVSISDTAIERCGTGDGQNHNIYLGGVKLADTHDLAVLTRVRSVVCRVGHTVKSRARRLEIRLSTLGDDPAQPDYHASSVIDASWGGTLLVEDTDLFKEPGAEAFQFINFGAEIASTKTEHAVHAITIRRCRFRGFGLPARSPSPYVPIVIRVARERLRELVVEDCIFEGELHPSPIWTGSGSLLRLHGAHAFGTGNIVRPLRRLWTLRPTGTLHVEVSS